VFVSQVIGVAGFDKTSARRASLPAGAVPMLNNKLTDVRHHVLDLLEQGKLTEGQRLPGSREMAATLGISFLKVQQAIETLCQDGVLESVPRTGTFVQRGWEQRVLRENLAIYDQMHRLPWMSGLLDELNREIGGLRTTFAFKRGMFEVRTTHHVLVNNADYMDIGELLNECYPDRSAFFDRPMEPFCVNGRVVGIPIAFSPRVIFYNPAVFQRAGCPLPRPGWTWDEFMETVRILRRSLPGDRIIDWHANFFLWMNFVARSGGRLFDPAADDPVVFDSPKAVAGLKRFAELNTALGGEPCDFGELRAAFRRGEAAMHLHDRSGIHHLQMAGNEDWAVVPLPLMPDGEDVTSQAADLICVRNTCPSPAIARHYVRVMLSERVQDYLASVCHLIPIRRSSAYRSLNLGDPRDALFAVEMGKAWNEFNLAPPYPGALVTEGIGQLLARGTDLEKGIAELAQAARTWLGVRGQMKRAARDKSVFAG
jgi:ABC-type glycerol-3-phosphate transport system substrate-binding protein